jgi:hypothetical protein
MRALHLISEGSDVIPSHNMSSILRSVDILARSAGWTLQLSRRPSLGISFDGAPSEKDNFA